MDKSSVIKYPVADVIIIAVEKLSDPITTPKEYAFLNNLLAQLLKFQVGDYGRN